MDIGQLFSGLRIKVKPIPPASETLAAIVVPKKILTDDSYREQHWKVKEDVGTYFDSCALDIARAFWNTYGDSFQLVPSPEEQGRRKYSISNSSATCTYTVQAMGGSHTNTFRAWINEVVAIITLQQPSLVPEKQKSFLEGVLESHLLDYRRETFGVFYHGANKEVKQEGIALLTTLGIKPLEAAEYSGFMGYGRYSSKRFTSDQLSALFPEAKKE